MPTEAPPRRRELLTHSRQDCFKTCRRRHFYAYEVGLRPVTDAKALRMGSAFHDGIAALHRGESTDTACAHARRHYRDMPGHFDPDLWHLESETVLRFVCAYGWRWGNSLEVIATELPFRVPLVNPATGKATPTFDLAGKIDGIVRLEDGRLAVREAKFVGEDIGPDASLWRRLRMDLQISLYVDAARRLGYACDTVLYDVARKPAIEPTPVPVTDADGVKVVRDALGQRVRTKDGKKWRETASAADGYTLETRPCTVGEWGERLTTDITGRPDFYFARVEVPRLDQDVEQYQAELWDIQRQVRQAQLDGLHYRTVSRNTCPFCPYFSICSTNQTVDPDRPPAGFEVLADVHPELREDPNVDRRTPAPVVPAHAPAAGQQPAAGPAAREAELA